MNPIAALPSASSIVSAVVAPAILILACSSLITTTANRVSKVLDRLRDLSNTMESLQDDRSGPMQNKRAYLAVLLAKGAMRAGLLQHTLATLYLALGALILTSVCTWVGATRELNVNFIAVPMLASVIFLFYASTLLIRESRIALSAVKVEMDYVRQLVGGAERSPKKA